MAELDSTLRTRFAQSKLVAKTNFFSTPSQSPASIPGQSASLLNPTDRFTEPGFNAVTPAHDVSILLNETLPNTMETLRSHVNYLLSLTLPVGEKNRLRMKYWAMECRLEALRLLLDEAEENGIKLDEFAIDPANFDLSEFYLSGFDLSGIPIIGPDYQP